MNKSKRLEKIPPYLFVKIEEKKAELIKSGVDVIDFGIGDPDLPTPSRIFKKMRDVLETKEAGNYPSTKGELSFRQAVANWYKKRFNVNLDPADEVCSLIGSKEGLAHLSLAFIDQGDIALVPDPSYPVYKIATTLAGGEVFDLPLTARNNFLPELDKVPEAVLKKAKVLYVNYPNNPTGAVADLTFFAGAVAFAKEHNLLLVSDLAYSEMGYAGYKPPSLLEVPGAKEVAIEFHSLSKTYNMTGWRIGMAVGNPEAVQALATIKSNVDSGVFKAIQFAAIEALSADRQCVASNNAVFEERGKILVKGLNSLGWKMADLKATFYAWVPVPKGESSASFTEKLLDKCGILVVPGSGYGPSGEGYVRFAITLPKERIEAAIDRLAKAQIRF
ncbi:LL-diaminopimelate aminotransferase [candidate division WOR-1 bacterium RIFOXYA12_FULL_52_29]|uniref:Aminotransferase n=1 Tax=candidate division WOR-1 bacterium RIFOXYC12_FULL_54_18 TaxID=1802584 RepID=A0A1F4T6F7_UNCSA|nr:MAG: LL-diaminopimelate aminotransferase [candidate division WOR-1 bacterium RIFOXYA2_FULL_51_19]OGC17877.1 MAG: LL-diaminopimelate aminotransferase [candidate division WOR-1 bacterium RIFOXYA12_FULL_52_29]OGC26733.1 MAG: LL-diaminopimelate aminotransferase [candidate division WOR-1 bacterium RIFOXYB2_FULL_45_9]OGC28294.1 MAG: LL-diaminopimelate aminotransferase [candidate division WOR-1 bacterium RIFOXYC12_FULL_54_18]OGC31249.1 MAG: LL-diaminopimelate aminotransferase [candidate division WO